MNKAILLFLVLLLPACQEDDPCAGVRDIFQSPRGLTLTREEHVLGWGQTECFQCHQLWSIHVSPCTAILGDSAGDINAGIDPEDTTTCISCHGTNGVDGWGDTGAAQ